jgi:hypothetical protein
VGAARLLGCAGGPEGGGSAAGSLALLGRWGRWLSRGACAGGGGCERAGALGRDAGARGRFSVSSFLHSHTIKFIYNE